MITKPKWNLGSLFVSLILLILSYHSPCIASESSDQVTPYSQVNALRIKGKLETAKSLAYKYLKEQPENVDIMLQLGFIYYQTGEWYKSAIFFEKVLNTTPNYLDAKLGLIRVKVVQKKFADALKLIAQAKKQDPNDERIKPILIFYAKAYQAEKQKELKRKQEQKLRLINKAIACEHFNNAMGIVNCRLLMSPYDSDYLLAKSKIYFKLHLYAESANYAKKVLAHYPENKEAKMQISQIAKIKSKDIYGLNTLGISSLNQYVSDLRANWDYSSVQLGRQTPIGNFFAKVNYAARLGEKAPQEEIQFFPILDQYLYLDLDATYAEKPELFPTYTLSGEAYYTSPHFLGFSLGEQYSYIFKSSAYTKYTGSLYKDVDKFHFSVRLNHYVPRIGPTSTLAIGEVRRYINTYDTYVSLKLGGGTSPDLSDLETLNFLVITNKLCPSDEHALALNIF